MIDDNCFVAQRIKRLSAIEYKLNKLAWLKLSEMQDIGGCRAVMSSVPKVRRLVDSYRRSWHRHEFVDEDDYITRPKTSGYRSHHLIYRYRSDRNNTYNGLKIEIQIRSRLQHIWATAVETVGNFTHQALKSSAGQADWLRFFALMGSAIAIRERTPSVPNTPVDPARLKNEVREYAHRLDVVAKLRTYRVITNIVGGDKSKHGQYTLLILDASNKKVTISQFDSSELELGFDRYSEVEKEISGKSGLDALLVSTDSFRQLRRAYPNYFLDTRNFIELINNVIS